jgi:hypothetical protein
MKSIKRSNLTVSLYTCITIEFVVQWFLWLLPTGWRDEIFTESLLHFVFYLILAMIMFASLSQIVREFKTRGPYSLFPYIIFGVRTACFGLMFQIAYYPKFYIAQNMYVEAMQFAQNAPLGSALTAPVKLWYIGGGKEHQVEIWREESQKLIFFNEFRVERDSCGYLYNSSDETPQSMSYSTDRNDNVHFIDVKRLSKDWFYGCTNSF